MKEIPLTQKKVAVVDDEDYERISKFNWYALKNYNTWYARSYMGSKKNPCSMMHRIILGLERGDTRCGDHIDGNGLNNTRSNLRICDNTKNQWNRRLGSNNTSGFKGVYWFKNANTWGSQIKVNGVKIYLGSYHKIEDAIEAYREAALKHFGEFARL